MRLDIKRIRQYLTEITRNSQELKPFFDFRNSLVHRYWTVDDEKLIDNIKAGLNDFDHFVDETEAYLTAQDSKR